MNWLGIAFKRMPSQAALLHSSLCDRADVMRLSSGIMRRATVQLLANIMSVRV